MAPGKVSTARSWSAESRTVSPVAGPVTTSPETSTPPSSSRWRIRSANASDPTVATILAARPSRASPCATMEPEPPMTRSAAESSCSACPKRGTTSPRRIRSGLASPSTSTSVTAHSVQSIRGNVHTRSFMSARSCSFLRLLTCCGGAEDRVRRGRFGRVHPPAAARPAVVRRPAAARAGDARHRPDPAAARPAGRGDHRPPPRSPRRRTRHRRPARGRGRRRLRHQHRQHRRPRRDRHRLRRPRVVRRPPDHRRHPRRRRGVPRRCGPSRSSTASPATWPRAAPMRGCSTTRTRWP